MEDVITVNGKTYVAWPTPAAGSRVVLVIDRGWVIAGNLKEDGKRLTLTDGVHVLSWSGCGFDGMLRDPKSPSVKLKRLDQSISCPSDSEIFRVQVKDDWGL